MFGLLFVFWCMFDYLVDDFGGYYVFVYLYLDWLLFVGFGLDYYLLFA